MARRWAWHTPNEYDEGELHCRPLMVPVALLHYFGGALAELTVPRNWEQVGTITPQIMAERMTALLTAWYDEECGMNCEELLACLQTLDANEFPTTGEFRYDDGQLQWSHDGETWVDVPTQPDGPTYYPPLNPTTGATDAEKMCLAATRAAHGLDASFKATFGAIAAGLHNSLNDFNVFLLELNRTLFGIVASKWTWLADIVGYYDIDIAEPDVFAPGMEPEALEALICLLLEHASVSGAGIVTFDHGAVFDNLIAEVGANPGTALTIIVGSLGAEGLNQAGNVAWVDDGDCVPCDDVWCYEFNFTANDGGFTAISGEAIWVSGQGWKGDAGGSNEGLYFARAFASTITAIEITNANSGTYAAYQGFVVRQTNGAGAILVDDMAKANQAGTFRYVMGAPTVVGTGLWFRRNTHTSMSPIISKIRIEGEGENPFGSDNCP